MIKENIKIIHPTHGVGKVIRRIDDYTVLIEYENPPAWGNPVEQSICNLKIMQE